MKQGTTLSLSVADVHAAIEEYLNAHVFASESKIVVKAFTQAPKNNYGNTEGFSVTVEPIAPVVSAIPPEVNP